MDGITAYALSKKVAASAVSGVQSMSVSGQTLTIKSILEVMERQHIIRVEC